ncbi:MAG: Rid family detoxifying hydrolase [Ginsengibacter sp.]
MNKQIIKTEKAPEPIGPYNQAISANGFLFISGQVAIIPGTPDMRLDSITSETEQVMNNLNAVLSEAGLTFENVVKTTIFLKDMQLFTEVNAIYGKYFTDQFPARETVAVKGLPKDVNVEISMIACY